MQTENDKSDGAAARDMVAEGSPAAPAGEAETVAAIERHADTIIDAITQEDEHDVIKRDNLVFGFVMLHVVTLRNGAIIAAGVERPSGPEPVGEERAQWKELARTQTDSLVQHLRDNI